MSFYLSRTDGELVDLARRGDRSARGVLVDRTLLPASRVAMHLEPSVDAAVAALVAAYGDTFRRLDGLDDGGRFLPVLLERLDHRAPFPLDPATHAPLDPVDRDRVRRAVLGTPRGRRGIPLAAALLAAAVGALALVATTAPRGGITVEDTPDPVGQDVAPAPSPSPSTPAATETTPTLSPTPTGTGAPEDTTADDATPDDAAPDDATPADAAPDDGTESPTRLPDTR